MHVGPWYKRRRRWDAQAAPYRLGPGLVTGAADDDPSGIATYSQAGAQFGYATLWTLFLTIPLMIAVQIISARVGAASGKGLIANIARHHGRPLLVTLVAMLFAANVFNIAADIAAMGEALRLVVGGPPNGHALVFALVTLLLQLFVPYRRYAEFLKWSTLVLFVYVAAALTLAVPWRQVARAFVFPDIRLTSDYLLIVVAVLGTTISPYLFFWQAAQEVEEAHRAVSPRRRTSAAKAQHMAVERIFVDTTVGMIFSNLVAGFIVITAAAALHANGVTEIRTAAEAAEALRPVAGDLTFALFAIGIIGTGLLAVPVLAGSVAYAAAELFAWQSSLELMPWRASGFYGTIVLAVGLGVAIDYMDADPIRMLVWSAVVNGIVAVPMMAMLMRLTHVPEAIGLPLPGRALRWLGWAATLVMGAVVLALAWTSLSG